MRCEEFEIRLNDVVDQHRAADSDLELFAHAAGCASCEQLLRGYESLLDAVAHMEKVEPSADLAYRVVAAWQSRRKADVRRRVRIELALAASLLVAALPGFLWLRSRPARAPVERSAAQGSQANSLAVSGVPRPALIDQARDAYQPLLAAAGKNVFDVLSSFPFEDEPAQADLDARPDSDEEGAVLGEISPLAESATRSVVALFRILPGTAVSFEARGLNQ